MAVSAIPDDEEPETSSSNLVGPNSDIASRLDHQMPENQGAQMAGPLVIDRSSL